MLKAISLIVLFIPLAYVAMEYFGDTFKGMVEKGLDRLGS